MIEPTVTILIGHSLDKLELLEDESVHCAVTSPPYWGLRDYSRCTCTVGYGMTESSDQGGPTEINYRIKDPDPDCPKCGGTGYRQELIRVWDDEGSCDHDFNVVAPPRRSRSTNDVKDPSTMQNDNIGANIDLKPTAFCSKCGAWKGQLGLEPTPELYVKHLVQIFRELRRVLRKDGTFWLNLGDCYCAAAAGNPTMSGLNRNHPSASHSQRMSTTGPHLEPNLYTVANFCKPNRYGIYGLKPKDLVGIPWRVAFALQEDGWWLRKDVIWGKPNPMPESVRDRCTSSHEYIFHFAKSERYFYDQEAIREPYVMNRWGGAIKKKDASHDYKYDADPMAGGRSLTREMNCYAGTGRNKRDIWWLKTAQYKEAHFAVFPEELPETCIKAGTSAKGCCAKCGAPWERQVDVDRSECETETWDEGEDELTWKQAMDTHHTRKNVTGIFDYCMGAKRETVGWLPSCECNGKFDDDGTYVPAIPLDQHPIVPCTVLDMFGGSGTTGMVAKSLGRNAIIIEINPEYADLIKKRTDERYAELQKALAERTRLDITPLDEFVKEGPA